MKLYHATPKHNATSILKNGLTVSNGEEHMYNGSDTKNLVFLANDFDIAYNFVDSAENFDDEEEIVVFVVDSEKLIQKDIRPDRNIIFDDEIYAFEYSHNIPANMLTICEE